jgi:hypothetical protein
MPEPTRPLPDFSATAECTTAECTTAEFADADFTDADFTDADFTDADFTDDSIPARPSRATAPAPSFPRLRRLFR